VHLSFVIAGGCLGCEIGEPAAPVLITAADQNTAATAWSSALEEAAAGALGECLWPGVTDNYRWMFRRQGESAHRGAAQYRHADRLGARLWGECDAAPFFDQARGRVADQLSGSVRSPASSSSSS
jgi:hypothetical protein